MFQYRFDSLQVKLYLIYSFKNTVYEVAQEFPNNLRLESQKIRKYENNIKSEWRQSLVHSLYRLNQTS